MVFPSCKSRPRFYSYIFRIDSDRVCEFLFSLLLYHSGLADASGGDRAEDEPPVVVYVQRDPSKAVRSISNNDDVVAELEDAVGAANVVVHKGTESLSTQLRMFARARVVVAAHGAGLANLITAPPGCQVVLLPMRPLVDHSFLHLTAALDARVTVLSDIGAYYYGNYGHLGEEQLAQIRQAVEAAWRPLSGDAVEGSAADVVHGEL